MLSTTLSYLFAVRPLSTMGFSGVTGTSSIYLPGPGGQAGNGFPLPRKGYVTGLQVWDGTTLRSDTDLISFIEGDKLAVYCQSSGSDFSVKVRMNGVSTPLEVTAVPYSSTLFVVVEFMLIR